MSTERETQIRIARLEVLVEHLFTHLGIPQPTGMTASGAPMIGGPLNTGISDRVRALKLSGDVIGAIKAYREETGTDLASAKAIIESVV